MDAGLITDTSTLSAQNAYANALAAKASSKLSSAAAQSPDKVKAAAKDFEAFFAGQMMEYMSEGIKADGVFGGGQAEDTWRSMLNQEYGKQIAKSGRLGISDSVMKSMLQTQEKAAAASGATPTAAQSDAAVTAPDGTPIDTTQASIVAGTLVRGKSVMA